MSVGTCRPPISSSTVTTTAQAITAYRARGHTDATIAAMITERMVWPLG
jgi:hypothetical protein